MSVADPRSHGIQFGLRVRIHPAGFAAAFLYEAGREAGRWLTQTDITEVTNMSTATVRNHRDTLEEQAV